jgi:hypothetical protein
MPKEKETVTCPQCSGRGWRFPGFWEKPFTILKYVEFVLKRQWDLVVIACKESFGFCHCRACDQKGVVPKDWLEGEE